MVTTALFIIAQNWETTQIAISKRTNILWYIHKMKYYSAIKKNKGLIHATAWDESQKHHAE